MTNPKGARRPEHVAWVAKVRAWLTENAVTQCALADEVGVTHPTISQIMRGHRYHFSSLARIAEAVEIPYPWEAGQEIGKPPRHSSLGPAALARAIESRLRCLAPYADSSPKAYEGAWAAILVAIRKLQP